MRGKHTEVRIQVVGHCGRFARAGPIYTVGMQTERLDKYRAVG